MLFNTTPEQRELILKEFTKELIKNCSPIEVYELENRIKTNDEKNKKQTEEKKELKRELNEIKTKPIDKNLIKQKVLEGYQSSQKTPSFQKHTYKDTGMFSEYTATKPLSVKKIPPPKKIPQKKQFAKKPAKKLPPKKFSFSENTQPEKNVYKEFNQSHNKLPLPQALKEIRPVPEKKEIDLERLNTFINDDSIKEIECQGEDVPIILRGNKGNKKTNIFLTSGEIDTVINEFSQKTKIPAQQGIYKVLYGNLSFVAIISNIGNTKFLIRKIPIRNMPPQHPPIQNRFNTKYPPKYPIR